MKMLMAMVAMVMTLFFGYVTLEMADQRALGAAAVSAIITGVLFATCFYLTVRADKVSHAQ